MIGFLLSLLGIIMVFVIGVVLALSIIIYAARESDEDTGYSVIKSIVNVMPNYAKRQLRDELDEELGKKDWY